MRAGKASAEECAWQAIALAPKIAANTASYLYNPQTGKYVNAASETALTMAQTGTPSVWLFTLDGDNCRIISQSYPGKCLSSDAEGNVTLVNISSSPNQLWYIGLVNGKYTIVNEQYRTYFYAETDAAGAVRCRTDVTGVSLENERYWQLPEMGAKPHNYVNGEHENNRQTQV